MTDIVDDLERYEAFSDDDYELIDRAVCEIQRLRKEKKELEKAARFVVMDAKEYANKTSSGWVISHNVFERLQSAMDWQHK